ncbi:MAG: dTDP-glucose 4,6-dehydratase [Actinobacteria bacterium]|nr:dTDP-glucose 4,6-dehydratase [Actinomycetota bacterium]
MGSTPTAFTPRRVLVTGGCGFIGSNFIRYLLTSDPAVEIVNLDALTYCGNPENLRDVETAFGGHRNPGLHDSASRYIFIRGDIRDPNAVSRAMADCDCVVHFAAESHVDRSIACADDFITTNVLGTHRLLEEARLRGVNRFLHVSTDEVYGSTLEGSFGENDLLDPSSPYSASKAAADLLVLSYYTTYGMPVMITRSTNNFGPYQYPEKLIPLFVTNLMEGRRVPLYGDGGNVRDWIYVLDNCRALDTVLRQGEIATVYNVGAGNEVTNRLITDTILELLGAGEEMVEYVTDRLGHDRRYSVTTERIQALGWAPERDFRQALADTVDWYRANTDWWRPLKDAVC